MTDWNVLYAAGRMVRAHNGQCTATANVGVHETGRLIVQRLTLENETGRIGAGLIREIRLGALERVINQPDVRERLTLSLPTTRAGKRRPVRRPRVKRFPREFYVDVADAYRDAVAYQRPPAPFIAEEAGVALGTARRWIKEARERGILGPGRRGTAGEVT